jgi:hypothetical protein
VVSGVVRQDGVSSGGVCQDGAGVAEAGVAGACHEDEVGATGEERQDGVSSGGLCQDGVGSAGACQDVGSAGACQEGVPPAARCQDGTSSGGPGRDDAGPAGACQGGAGSRVLRQEAGSPAGAGSLRCQDGGCSTGDCQGGAGSGCCHAGLAPGVADHGWSSAGGVGQAVPEIAGSRVNGSTGGRSSSELPPVCQASVVERHPLVPVLERHSVVCRHRDSDVERHSEVAERQPTPSGGKAGRPVGATSDQRLVGTSSVPDCSVLDEGRCDHASARSAQATASGTGSMLPVSVIDVQPGWSVSGPDRRREVVGAARRSAEGPAGSDDSWLSGTFPVDQASGVRRSRGSLAP